MSNNPLIDEISEGDDFTGFYALRRCELREYDGGFRLDIELSDKSGQYQSPPQHKQSFSQTFSLQ